VGIVMTPNHAAQSTFDAVLFVLRNYGVARLADTARQSIG
jgi:hypothetical protein